MAEGGFLVKFEPAKAKPKRCYAVAFSFDDWSYAVNNEKMKELPKGIDKITLVVESD